MKLLLFEDDHQHAKYIEVVLRQTFPNLEIDEITTEKEFRDQLPQILTTGYDIIILDVMAPWTRVGRDMAAPPEDVKEEGFYRAGVRCYELLRDSSKDLAERVLFYTILDKEALRVPEGARVFSKNADPDLKDLMQEIVRLSSGG